MPEERSAPSRRLEGFSKGKKPFGKQVLGKIEELGELVCKFNTEDQADLCVRATEVSLTALVWNAAKK